MTRLLEHPVADRHDQTAGLGGRYEDIGRDQAAMFVIPPDQGFEADRTAGLQIDDRLVVQGEVFLPQRLSQLFLELDLAHRFFMK